MIPKRGEVWWVDLEPTRGGEMQKTRPCVVLTNDILNQHRLTVVIVPLSTTSPKAKPLYVPVPSAGAKSQAVIDQVRVVDKSRLLGRVGELAERELEEVSAALMRVLSLR